MEHQRFLPKSPGSGDPPDYVHFHGYSPTGHQAAIKLMDRTLNGSYRWYAEAGKHIYYSVALGIAAKLSLERIDLKIDLV